MTTSGSQLMSSLTPRLVDPLWHRVDAPRDEEAELTRLEQEHEAKVKAIAKSYSDIVPIGKTSHEPPDDEDEDDDDADDNDDSDSPDDEDDEDVEMDVTFNGGVAAAAARGGQNAGAGGNNAAGNANGGGEAAGGAT